MANETEKNFVWTEFFVKYSKRIVIGFSVFITMSLLLIGGYWIYTSFFTGNVVARVGNVDLTRDQYDSEKNQCKTGMKFANTGKNDSEIDYSSCTKKALDDLIYLEALRQDAIANNVDVSPRVESDYQAIVSRYKDEESAISDYKDSFGETKEDIKKSLEVRALEDGLSDILLKKLTVVSAFVRSDNWGKENLKQEEVDALAILNKYYVEAVKSGKSEDELQKIAAQLRLENPKYDNELKNYTGINKLDQLNDGNHKKWFSQTGSNDWDELKKLKNVGDTTPAFTSPGEAVIWRLEAANNGQYSSWDQYRESVVSKAKVSSLDYVGNEYITQLAKLLPGSKAYAEDCAAHMVSFIVDKIYFVGTTTSIASGSGKIYFEEDSTNVKAGGYNDNCSKGVKSGYLDPSDNSFNIGDNATYLNCNTRWAITLYSQNSTFFKVNYQDRSFINNKTNLHLDRDLVGYDAYARRYFNTDESTKINSNTDELGDNDGIITVVKNDPPTARYVTPDAAKNYPAATWGGNASISRLKGDATDKDTRDLVSIKAEYRKIKDYAGNSDVSSWYNFGCDASSSPISGTDSVPYFGSPRDCAKAAANNASHGGWYEKTDDGDQDINYTEEGYDKSVGPALSLPAGTYEWAVQAQDKLGLFSPWVTGRTFTVSNPTTNATLKSAVSPAGAATASADQTADTTTVAVTKTAGYSNVNSAYSSNPTWSGGCNTSGQYTFAAGNTSTVTCTATFTLKPVTTKATYNVTAGTGGTVDIDNSGTYAATKSKSYTTTTAAQPYSAQAKANGGYTFNNSWTPSNCNTGTFPIGSTTTLSCTANFTAVVIPPPGSHNLQVNKAGSGSGSVSSASVAIAGISGSSFPMVKSVADGTSTTITATPDSSSTFTNWSGCTSVSGNDCKVTNITADKTVTVTFAVKGVPVACSWGTKDFAVSEAKGPAPFGVNFKFTAPSNATSYYIDYDVNNVAGNPGGSGEHSANKPNSPQPYTYSKPGIYLARITCDGQTSGQDLTIEVEASSNKEPEIVFSAGSPADGANITTSALTTGHFGATITDKDTVPEPVKLRVYYTEMTGTDPITHLATTDCAGEEWCWYTSDEGFKPSGRTENKPMSSGFEVGKTYLWFGMGTDGFTTVNVAGEVITRYVKTGVRAFTVIAGPSFSCGVFPPSGETGDGAEVRTTVTPTGGPAIPFVLEYQTKGTTDRQALPTTDTLSPLNVTFSALGTYEVWAKSTDGGTYEALGWQSCGEVEVTNPGEKGGGEQ